MANTKDLSHERQLRLKKLAEREIDPKDLGDVHGGGIKSTRFTRYCPL